MAKYYTVKVKDNGGIDNEVSTIFPNNGKNFSYAELREYVGGMVEIVPLPSGKSMVVNEEGKLIGLEYNELASWAWSKEYPIEKYPHNNDQTVVGNALICDEVELSEE